MMEARPVAMMNQIISTIDKHCLSISKVLVNGIDVTTTPVLQELDVDTLLDFESGELTVCLPLSDAYQLFCCFSAPTSDGILILGNVGYVRLEPLKGIACLLCDDGTLDRTPEESNSALAVLAAITPPSFVYNGNTVEARLLQTPGPMNLAMLLMGHDDDYNPPHVNEIGLELHFNQQPSVLDVRNCVTAYLYELSRKELYFNAVGPGKPYDLIDDFDLPALVTPAITLKPHVLDSSIQPLLKYYSKGVQRMLNEDWDMAYLNFFKVLEHAGGVITLKLMADWSSNGPKTVRALKALTGQLTDEAVIAKLIATLALPPTYAATVLRLTGKSETANVLSSTRNYYSHAKSGYALRGTEIQEQQLPDGCTLIREIAERVIEWYAALPDSEKLTA